MHSTVIIGSFLHMAGRKTSAGYHKTAGSVQRNAFVLFQRLHARSGTPDFMQASSRPADAVLHVAADHVGTFSMILSIAMQ